MTVLPSSPSLFSLEASQGGIRTYTDVAQQNWHQNKVCKYYDYDTHAVIRVRSLITPMSITIRTAKPTASARGAVRPAGNVSA